MTYPLFVVVAQSRLDWSRAEAKAFDHKPSTTEVSAVAAPLGTDRYWLHYLHTDEQSAARGELRPARWVSVDEGLPALGSRAKWLAVLVRMKPVPEPFPLTGIYTSDGWDVPAPPGARPKVVAWADVLPPLPEGE